MLPLQDSPDAYFVRTGADRFRATGHTAGAWSETEQHISPLNGLCLHAIEQYVAARDAEPDGKQVSRFTLDILGPVPIEECTISVQPVRPGRGVELLEAVVACRDREVLRGRAWRTLVTETGPVAGGGPAPMPGPDEVPQWDMRSVWPGGYIASIDVRRSADAVPGRARAWVSSPLDLVAGEQVSDLARFVMLVDTANGICVREDPEAWLFPNVDLSIHLVRQPVAGPVGFDIEVTFGAEGLGLTSTVLHDVAGPVGRAAQSLTIRRRG